MKLSVVFFCKSAALLMFILIGSALCGCDSAPDDARVSGRVTFLGQPLDGGLIVFSPDEDRGGSGPIISAPIGPEGVFVLNGDSGAPIRPGWYRVAIAPKPGVSQVPSLDQTGPVVPLKYRHAEQSGLLREVKRGRNDFDFALSDR